MRQVIFLDYKIADDEYNAWVKEDTLFWEKYFDVTPEYWVIRHDFKNYPYEIDGDGDVRPSQAYMTALHDDVFKKYSKDGTDYVMTVIHEDNWQSSGVLFDNIRTSKGLPKKNGIWGTAWAYKYRDYLSVYARWDKDNSANVFGTLYHERCHPLDVLIKVELGIDINKIIEKEIRAIYSNDKGIIAYLDKNGFNYDRDFVHGALKPPMSYIRHKENTWVLAIIAPYVRQALKKREERHLVYMGLQKTTISLLEKMVYLYRQMLYKKDGIKK